MSKVTVFQFEIYDVINDVMHKSRRWGTREAIKNICCGRVLENTATEVDKLAVMSEIDGLTEIGFNPQKSEGFQTSVKP